MVKGVEESKQKALRRLLNGLGIPHVGKKMAQDIATELTTQDFSTELINEEFLRNIYGIGEKTIENMKAFFHNEHNRSIILQLQAAGVNMDPKKYTDLIKPIDAKGSFSIT